MPDIATGAGDRKRRPIQHAGEVTRKRGKANNGEVDEEPPAFTKSKIGGAKDITGKSFEIADATGTSLDAESDFRAIGGIRAEEATKARGQAPCSGVPIHLSKAHPGWRRHWGTLTNEQAWSWTGTPSIVVSKFCKTCMEGGTRCVREEIPRATRFACDSCTVLHSECHWLIAYKSHPREEFDIESLPDYRTRFMARQNRSAIGTEFEVSESAVIVLERPRPLAKVVSETPTTKAPPPLPAPTYSEARSAYEDLVAAEYDEQCKRNADMEPIDWKTIPTFWEAEVAMGRLGDAPMTEGNISYFRPKPMNRQRRARNIKEEVGMFAERSDYFNHAPTFSRDGHCSLRFSIQEGKLGTVSDQEMVFRLLVWLLPPPRFELLSTVVMRHKLKKVLTGVVTNRKLGKTWMYYVNFRWFSKRRPVEYFSMWCPEYYLRHPGSSG